MLRDEHGRVHLGQDKTVKSLFSRNGAGCRSFVKSEHEQCTCMYLCICFEEKMHLLDD